MLITGQKYSCDVMVIEIIILGSGLAPIPHEIDYLIMYKLLLPKQTKAVRHYFYRYQVGYEICGIVVVYNSYKNIRNFTTKDAPINFSIVEHHGGKLLYICVTIHIIHTTCDHCIISYKFNENLKKARQILEHKNLV